MKVIDDDDDVDDDDERKNSKKAKFLSNDRSGHDDQFCPKIVEIGATLAIFQPFEVLKIHMPLFGEFRRSSRDLYRNPL